MKQETKRDVTPRLRFPEFREEWAEVRLSQLANSISDRVGTTPCIPYTVTSGMGLVSQQEKLGRTIAGNSLRNYIRLQKDDFAYNKSATKAYPEGYIARYLDEANAAVPNSIFTCFRVDREKADPAYLDFLFSGNLHGRWLRKFLAIGARAHGSLNVSDDDLMALPVPLPSPPEQRKIADCLGSLDSLIATEGRKLAALRDHKRGLMQQLFPQLGQTQPRLRFPEFRGKGEWSEHALIDIATFRRGSFPQPYGLPEWYDEQDGMPFIQVFDVGNDLRVKERTKSKISKLGAEKSVFIPNGTLIVTLQGSIGRVAITHYDAFIDRTLLIFETFLRPIEKSFFAYLIQNLFDLEKEKAPGGIIKTITKEALSDFKVKIPKISEQQKIAVCLSSLDSLITAQAEKIESLKQHKRGLMQQLFPAPEGQE
ncbi:MAG: restriction endonuclease subunit S [Spirochaetaceae bacterium]|nr:MAG: restriction endonuclease subunit S [Spirochaetaceae bacterium]